MGPLMAPRRFEDHALTAVFDVMSLFTLTQLHMSTSIFTNMAQDFWKTFSIGTGSRTA
jgi:hypothetical protein